MHQLIHYNMGSKSAIGIGNGICFKQVRDKGGGSYIDPLVRDSIVGLWKSDQNTNESPTRNIIKNTIKDKGGDLELFNFGYKLNSGYGKYEEDFTSWEHELNIMVYHNKFTYTEDRTSPANIIHLKINKRAVNSFKIKVEGLPDGQILAYSYFKQENDNERTEFLMKQNGEYILPPSMTPSSTTEDIIGFYNTQYKGNIKGLTITQIPSFEGALVTDGKDDLIVSQNTVQEMLGGSNEVTVVSMMLNLENEKITYTNQIRPFQNGYIRNNVISNTGGKYGIYGYKITDITDIFKNRISINDILGDRKDYGMDAGGTARIDGKFSVEGYCFNDGTIGEVSQVAWYWTIISKIALTTDQINQVISYFNLDKHVKPDIIYDTIRQGITNENHASFNDELTDFSGNGHNLKLYNLNWDKQSGIGSYPFSFKDYNYFSDRADVSVNKSNFVLTANFNSNNFLEINTKNTEVPSFKIKAEGIDTITNGRLAYRIAAFDGSISIKYISEDGEYEIPESSLTENTAYSGFYVSGGINDNVRVKVTIISDYEGALVSDGIDDYGKVENLPIYKDYTVVADREIVNGLIDNAGGGVATRSYNYAKGAFGFDWKNQAFSFGGNTDRIIDVQRFISYQSKYVNNGIQLITGNVVDNNPLYMARLGEENRYSKLALWSFLLFSYTLSEFLLERQLKRYKLGTLYPGMIEWRPKVNINVPVVTPPTFSMNNGSDIITNGQYIPEGTEITIRIYTTTDSSVVGINEATAKINGADIELSPSGNKTYYGGKFIVSSKQKIDITIDEYIRYENIVQPYPAIINLKQDGKSITWGDKLKVGSEVTFVNHTNLLPDLYTVSGGVQYNGTSISWNTSIRVEKSMVFVNPHSYKKANEPNCILAPQTLRIPNSSYKILGYIPDLTGKGNHGRLNNFAYTEESGANEDGSIRFDGRDDHITIPTLTHGGKCMLMKVNWNKDGLMLYDQRGDNNPNSFAIYIPNFNNEDSIAYSSRNDGKTYIDGVLNTSVKNSQLKDVTHNITITNSNSNNNNTVSQVIGSNAKHNTFYAQMVLYEFMLFPDVPNEEEIKELNDIVGIEGGYVESPNYYWDAYGKKNTDTDRNLIVDQVSKDVANTLEVKNVGYNSESGYTDDNGLLLDGVEDHLINTAIPAVTDFTVIAKREFLESTLVNNQTFLVKGDAINGNNSVNSLLMECYYGTQNYIISFSYQQIVLLEESKISWITPTSYNGNALTKGSGVDSAGLTIGRYRDLYRKAVFYKAMFYTKTIDQLSINMLKNLFERDELIDVTNPIFKKKEL